GRSAVTAADFFDDPQLFIEHDQTRYPTGLKGGLSPLVKPFPAEKEQSMILRNYGYGNSFCLSCHASAVSASTFASLDNILGQEILYEHQQDDTTKPTDPCTGQGGHLGESPDFAKFKYSKPLNELEQADKKLIQAFLTQFPQFTQPPNKRPQNLGCVPHQAHVFTSPTSPRALATASDSWTAILDA
ncbi:MAG: hypothetical protein IIB33_00425, partial [Chloroflexi bacterium]|nr:hypothetical protein [Chloroflexota bacterium]